VRKIAETARVRFEGMPGLRSKAFTLHTLGAVGHSGQCGIASHSGADQGSASVIRLPPIAHQSLQRLGVRRSRLDLHSYAAFVASLGEARWLGRRAARAHVIANMILLLLLVTRGLLYPELSDNTAPWYKQPVFIAGIPAIPWTMPGLLDVVLMRRAGDHE
jgi:hypothetical protein